jgi:hypothetical protein
MVPKAMLGIIGDRTSDNTTLTFSSFRSLLLLLLSSSVLNEESLLLLLLLDFLAVSRRFTSSLPHATQA